MEDKSKYYTYSVSSAMLPDDKATLMIDSLSAQKHFLLNAVLKGKKIDASEKQKIKKCEEIEFEGFSYDEESLELIKSSEIKSYIVFTKTFRGKACPVDQIIAWTKELLKVCESDKICLRMQQTHPGIIKSEDGFRMRPALGLERKNSPIYLSTEKGKLPMVHVYLMIIGAGGL